MTSSAAARVVFALLVAATGAAFFVTQRLKTEDPVVKRLALQRFFSPNGDGRKERAGISFQLPEGDLVTVEVVNAGGDRIRRLADDRSLRAGTHSLSWDGRDDQGGVPRDGTYYVRVSLREQGRAVTGPRGIVLTTEAPKPRIVSVTPGRVATARRAAVAVRFTGPAVVRPIFRVWRTDGEVREVARFTTPRGRYVGVWDGRVRGRPAPEGSYAFSVTVQNRALIEGSSPGRLPPTRGGARPGTGVRIAGPEAVLPVEAVPAGTVARIEVTGGTGALAWRLSRVGSDRVLRRGRGRGGTTVAFRVPRGLPAGEYIVRIAAGSRPIRVPLTVNKPTPARVLVVVPAITWLGRNPIDDDLDGFPDTLDVSDTVALTRPLAGGRLPAGFERQIAPLFEFLQRRRLRHDIATDLQVARQNGIEQKDAAGILLAGDERWLPPATGRALRDYVEKGGTVVSLGTDSLRREVDLTRDALRNPTGPRPASVFGEDTRPFESLLAPLVATKDDLGLFAGTDGAVGLFTRFEQAERPAPNTQLLVNAGRDPAKPALAAYRVGKGLFVRVGTPQWSRALAGRPEVAAVMARLWGQLER